MDIRNGFSSDHSLVTSPTAPQVLSNGHSGQVTKSPHARQTLSMWQELAELRWDSACSINGKNLSVAKVVAVAKYSVDVHLSPDPQIQQQIEESIHTLENHLKRGHLVYGVTTGFGGSADTRTTDLPSLQRALLQHQESGILSRVDAGHEPANSSTVELGIQDDDYDASFDVQSMPTSWVRASMLTRCNSIIRGHSAVRTVAAKNILSLLRHHLTPVVPLRGSISASGDLSPLSYIAGAIEGNPDIFIRRGKDANSTTTAQHALKEAGLEPLVFHAKEGLGLLNGTAFSAATASLAIFQAQEAIILSQVLTSMATEALQGTAESYHPMIAQMRPHSGQIECAANIFSFLQGSRLARGLEASTGDESNNHVGDPELCQDRYSFRTSSQWIGPQIEDLRHAEAQLVTELNSTTDNPLIHAAQDRILHGGNFQAAVVTSTMDRTRLALDKLGRMLYSQATELINPTTNKGLPPNLCSDDPSLSFTCKGADINMAAYMSELSFLANPVGNHVVSAEMHNQAINSLALVSSRYTFHALTTLRMLCATYLFIVTQALDLRVLQNEFLKSVKPDVDELVVSWYGGSLADAGLNDSDLGSLQAEVWSAITTAWPQTTTLDLSERAMKTAKCIIPAIVEYFSMASTTNHKMTLKDACSISGFTTTLKNALVSGYSSTRMKLNRDHLSITSTHLGTAAKAMYLFVRSDPATGGLGIKFHQGLVEHPTHPLPHHMIELEMPARKTIGTRISTIYEAIGNGEIREVLSKILMTTLD